MIRSHGVPLLSHSVVICALLLWLGQADQGWLLYDEFREMWGALSLLVGGTIQWAGGGAAGLDHASPLTSMLYAAALRVKLLEHVPLALECGLFCLGFAAYWITARSGLTRLWLMVGAASAYRLIDIRSGMDQIGMVGLALALVALLQHLRWRMAPRWVPVLGLSIGLLPHLHASGIFVASAIVIRLIAAQRQAHIRDSLVLIGTGLLPMGYWLLDLSAVDANRGMPYVNWLDLPRNVLYTVQGVFGADTVWLESIGLPRTWPGLAYRLLVGGFWAATVGPALFRANKVQSGLLVLFWVVLLARSDYMLVTQHMVAIAMTCILLDQPVHIRGKLYAWALACIAVQAPLTLYVQHQATEQGFYRVPYQYFVLATPQMNEGYGAMIELVTARRRATMIEQYTQTGRRPLLSPKVRLNVSDILSFAPTGFLHLTDLVEPPHRAALEQLATNAPSLQPALHKTLTWDKMQLSELSSERMYGESYRAVQPEDRSWACIPSEFLLRSHCPQCLRTWLQIPLQHRRSGLMASCTSEPLPEQLHTTASFHVDP